PLCTATCSSMASAASSFRSLASRPLTSSSPPSTWFKLMKELFSDIRGAVMSTLVLAVVCCGIYPLIVFGIAQAAFHDKANGSLIVEKDGTVRGSRLIGQQFTADKYFHSRPSAAGNGYDAANSSG